MPDTTEPFYQSLIKRLPFMRAMAARTLGVLAGPEVKAVVNQAILRLDLGEAIQRQLFLGTYEPVETQWFRECVSPGDTFVDVGANFGHYTTLGSLIVGPSGRVFAFEPSPKASQVLREGILASGISNIVLTQAAVGKSPGEVTLFMPNTRHLHSPSILESDPEFTGIKVSVIALDDFEPLRNVPNIKLLKMDVEGYEPDVLCGMTGLIKARKLKNIFCELNSAWLRRNQTTPEELRNRILGLGFRVFKQTELQKDLPGHHGERYDLQDIWFSLDS